MTLTRRVGSLYVQSEALVAHSTVNPSVSLNWLPSVESVACGAAGGYKDYDKPVLGSVKFGHVIRSFGGVSHGLGG